MKRFLLGAMCLSTMSLYAQETEQQIRLTVKVIPSTSAQFNVNDLTMEMNGVNEEDIIWNAENMTFECLLPRWGAGFYKIHSSDDRIYYEGIVEAPNGEETDPESEIAIRDTADFSGYYFVNISPASESYQTRVVYLGKPRTNEWQDEVMTPNAVHNNIIENATYLKPGEYECEVITTEQESGIPIVTQPKLLQVGHQDLNYRFDAELEKKHLVTIQVKDTENQPMSGSKIAFTDISEKYNITCDASGNARVYLADGEYIYSPAHEQMTIFFDPSILSRFSVSGNDVQTIYSLKDMGYCRQDITVTGDQISNVSVDVYSAYIYEDYDFDEDEVQNNRATFTFYAPKGKYCYNIEAADFYNNISYFPANGIIDLKENGNKNIHFTNNGQKLVRVTTTDFYADEVEFYDTNGTQVANARFLVSPSDENTGTMASSNSVSEANTIETTLLPGEYTLLIYDEDYMDQSKTIRSKKVVIPENGGMVTLNLTASDMPTGSLGYNMINLPEYMPDYINGKLYNSDGLFISNINYDKYSDPEYRNFFLSPGEYTIKWEKNIDGYSGDDYDIVLKYKQNVRIEEGTKYTAVVDFNQLATTKVNIDKPETSSLYGFDISRNGKAFLTDFIFDSSNHQFYLVSEPGDYQIKMWGRSYDTLKMNLFSQTEDFTQTMGQTGEVNLSLEETGEAPSCVIILNDINADEIYNATLTVNGKTYEADDCYAFHIDNIKEDAIHITIEAPGYETIHFSKNINEFEKDLFNMIELCFFMQKTGSATGIHETENRIVSVARVSADRFELNGDFTQSYAYKIVNMQGQALKNGKASPEQNQISLNGLPDGIYILILENGQQKYSVKFAK